MKVARTSQFKKAWKTLNDKDRAQAKKAIEHLVKDLRYPALKVKKMKGTDDIWEARASLSLRITFRRERDTIMLRNVGKHDEALSKP